MKRRRDPEAHPSPAPEAGGPAPADRSDAGAVLSFQRSAGNAATTRLVGRQAQPGQAFATATSGAPTGVPHRARMEQAFGSSFAGVRAYAGTSEARVGLARLGARAAAFGNSVAFADADPDERLVAHELAHVVQQRNAARAVQAKAVSATHAPAEQAADRAADAVARGERVPEVGTADLATVHRTTINTNGGVFDNATGYNANSGTGTVGERIGCDIWIEFTANDLVETPVDGIGLTQTVKGMTDRVSGTSTLHATRDQQSRASSHRDDQARFGTNDQAIDINTHTGGRDEPRNSPIYAVGYAAPAPATTLNDGAPSLGWGRRGSHVRDPATGVFAPPVSARMEDGPGRVIGVAGQSFEMTFETAALVTSGPMENTYLGSVEWGWQSDAAGAVTLKPFRALASGAPTASFMTAASTWNAAEFHDDSFWGMFADPVQTVDLPITTLPSGVQAAVDMTTVDLLARLPVVRAEITGLPAGPSVDRTNKGFELRALVTELATRKITLELTCNSISDTGGAASPPEDETWLALSGGGSPMLALTGERKFRNGDAHTYEFAITDFMPMTGTVHIDINEHDRAGTRSRAHDDVLIALDWLPPFAPLVRSDPAGHYTARVAFNK